ncbi:transcriptional regulator [Dinoroseobacter sp. PD6]|uniref:transcriptional regulator n=1 Tax=Dinoroseobacter sp. PD6 TaxID=3028384 RepID=UPI00237AC9AE|nr:transcriptional regulator [Dinoroseobacter sp. PD6]MDD9718425.1 transcriptional regulator [Dinoroseobacter sp. PD6]
MKNQTLELDFDASKSCPGAPFPVEAERSVHPQTQPSALFKPEQGSVMSTGPEQGTTQLVKLYVLGPLGLFSAGDRNLTPRGKKAQGLLALLALAPRGQRTRVWLRDKLWSTSDEQKSASSLRQTVFELRKDLGALADEILDINRMSIGLRLDRVWIDHATVMADPAQLHELEITEDTELLEGIDVVDEEFEDWLQMERQIWYDKAIDLLEAHPRPAPAARPTPAQTRGLLVPARSTEDLSETQAPQTCSIGFLPNIQQGCDGATQHLADYVLEGVARNLREFEPVAVFDFRDPGVHSDRFTNAFETEYYTRVRTLQVRDSLTLTFFLYRSSRMALEWSQSIQTSADEIVQNSMLLEGFIAQNVDRMAKSMFEDRLRMLDNREDWPPKVGYSALNLMFKLDENALSNSESMLLRGAESEEDSPIYPALRAYLTTFKLGENMGVLNRGELEDARANAEAALGQNPFNSISLACIAHVMGYVFHEHDMAGGLLEQALNLNASQPFVWDHYALHKLYSGEFEAAYRAAERGAALGAFSPISYSYDTTLAMAATMAGDHRRAIMAGQRALRKQPRFAAAMRYLLLNYAKLGREAEAQEMFTRLTAVDPDFGDPEVQKERFRFAQKQDETNVLSIIKRLTS